MYNLPQLPTPRYKIGEKVWTYTVVRKDQQLPCPDCLGRREWKAVAPSGFELMFGCPRCDSRSIQGVETSLMIEHWEVTTSQLTIGQINATTSLAEWRGSPIEYMCVETGIGGGAVFREDRVFPTQAQAQEAGTIEAEARNAKIVLKPISRWTHDVSLLPFREAILAEAHKSRRRAQYVIATFQEFLKDVKAKELSREDILEQITEILEDDPYVRALKEPPAQADTQG